MCTICSIFPSLFFSAFLNMRMAPKNPTLDGIVAETQVLSQVMASLSNEKVEQIQKKNYLRETRNVVFLVKGLEMITKEGR